MEIMTCWEANAPVSSFIFFLNLPQQQKYETILWLKKLSYIWADLALLCRGMLSQDLNRTHYYIEYIL